MKSWISPRFLRLKPIPKCNLFISLLTLSVLMEHGLFTYGCVGAIVAPVAFFPRLRKRIFESSAAEIKFAWTLLKIMNTQKPFHFNAISCGRTCATWREIMWRQTKSRDDTKVRMKIKQGEQKYGRDRGGNERRGGGRGECIRSVLSSHCDRSIIYEVRCVSVSACTLWITISHQTIATPLPLLWRGWVVRGREKETLREDEQANWKAMIRLFWAWTLAPID